MQRLLFAIYLTLSISLLNLAHAESIDTSKQSEQILELNINTASADEIASALKGVGEKKALAIVDFREHNGPFMSVDEVALVKGIGEKTIEKNRKVIKLK